MSTLCAGCGHDSITAALIEACFRTQHRAAQSGQDERYRLFVQNTGLFYRTPPTALTRSTAGCRRSQQAQTPQTAIFITSVFPATGTRCPSASGNSPTPCAAISTCSMSSRTTASMGLTKGQFSASADVGTKAKKGEVNLAIAHRPRFNRARHGRHIRRAQFFRRQGAARTADQSRSQASRGFALLDILSPCVTFNDHEDSTKSYAFSRQFYHPAIHTDFRSPCRGNPNLV